MERRFAFGLAVLALAATVLGSNGCARKEAPPQTLTERQRDSLLGVSGLPGAVVVTRALATQDSAAARAARMSQAPEVP
jgi:hypothetical protein